MKGLRGRLDRLERKLGSGDDYGDFSKLTITQAERVYPSRAALIAATRAPALGPPPPQESTTDLHIVCVRVSES